MNTHHPDRLTDAAGVRVLLYGDVDLNVIDGSATWLPSLAETLARTGASVDVQLKAVERRDLLTAPLRALTGVRVLPAEPAAGQGGMTPSRAADVLARRDEESRYDVVLVRGIHACLELADRGAFPGRLWSYVTEYGYVEDGFPAGRVEELGRIAAASRLMLAQTPQARAVLEAMVPAAAGRTELLSPMVPDALAPAERAEVPADGPERDAARAADGRQPPGLGERPDDDRGERPRGRPVQHPVRRLDEREPAPGRLPVRRPQDDPGQGEADEPGVLGRVTSAFGEHGVSIESMRQGVRRSEDGLASLTFMTHQAPEAALAATVDSIKKLADVDCVSSVLRAEGN